MEPLRRKNAEDLEEGLADFEAGDADPRWEFWRFAHSDFYHHTLEGEAQPFPISSTAALCWLTLVLSVSTLLDAYEAPMPPEQRLHYVVMAF